ncbi:MAG TPA: hydroxymethylbilane synthase [Myxococcaceae bacterium]|nr:hydroxymethylbilane synthase [Myxococcaceae bacterium]
MSELRIATRRSPLARWQADHVASLWGAAFPGTRVSLVEMTTAGDRFLEAPLQAVGGKGLFIKELEQALLEARADLAVHSLKDLTSAFPPGLCLAAVPAREDARDAWVSSRGVRLEAVPRGARVGTSSLRRGCLLRAARPDLEVVPLRGNVQTRLRKADELGLAGTVLAVAGLRRLGLEGRITEVLPPEVSLPAVGQGALALEARVADAETCTRAGALEDPPTRIAVDAERAFLARLEGGCTVPLGGHAVVEGDEVWLRGFVGAPDGSELVRGERRGPTTEAPELGRALAEDLLGRGADRLLAALATDRRA